MADLLDAGAADDDNTTDADIQKPVAKWLCVDANKSVNIIVPHNIMARLGLEYSDPYQDLNV